MKGLVKIFSGQKKKKKKNSGEVLLKSRGLSTNDFSTLYTTLIHNNLIKEKLIDLIERTFQRE